MIRNIRDEYLDAMGVQRWVARDACPSAEDDAGTGTVADSGVTAGSGSVADAGVSLLDWPELEERVSGCVLCGLQESRSRTVFGSGNHNADWLIIGEAPGVEEDREGQPFVGSAGQLLTEMFRAIGLQRDEVYICNILKCHPPDNRNPSVEETSHCNPYLHRQIELIRPRLILAVGGGAADGLLGLTGKVGSLCGKVDSYGPQKIPLVVTYHPAYLLRAPREKRKSWDDLLFARSVCMAGHGG